MKNLVMALSLIASLAWSANAEWHGFSLPETLGAKPIASRDIVNGQWLAGYAFDVLYWRPKFFQHSQFYLSAEHQYNAAELLHEPGNAAGVFGPGLGLSIGGLASKIAMVYRAITPDDSPVLGIPPWLMTDLDQWLTIEGNAGYRLFGHAPDVKPWTAGIGGKVGIKFDVLAHH